MTESIALIPNGSPSVPQSSSPRIPTRLSNTAKAVGNFFLANKGQLIGYVVAMGIIVCGVGLLYGWKATAVPLSIGMGCGLGFGMLTGVATGLFIDKTNKYPRNTIWGWMNHGLTILDGNGTRAIVVTVCVAVICATMVVFPHFAGAAIAIPVGNIVLTKLFYNGKKGWQKGDTTLTPEQMVQDQNINLATLPSPLNEENFKKVSSDVSVLLKEIEELKKKVENQQQNLKPSEV